MKRFSLILAAALIVSTLAGCSGKVEGEAPVQSVSMICGLGSTGLVDRFAGVVSARSETKIEKMKTGLWMRSEWRPETMLKRDKCSLHMTQKRRSWIWRKPD